MRGRRLTRHDYQDPGSMSRILEAAIALADTDSEDDEAYHRNRCRLNAAIQARVARQVRLLMFLRTPKPPKPDERQASLFGNSMQQTGQTDAENSRRTANGAR